MKVFDPKDPAAELDYVFDWTNWLGSDSILSHVITVPTGLTLLSSTVQDEKVTFWVSGGTHGKSYIIACKITTAAGRINEESCIIPVRNN